MLTALHSICFSGCVEIIPAVDTLLSELATPHNLERPHVYQECKEAPNTRDPSP